MPTPPNMRRDEIRGTSSSCSRTKVRKDSETDTNREITDQFPTTQLRNSQPTPTPELPTPNSRLGIGSSLGVGSCVVGSCLGSPLEVVSQVELGCTARSAVADRTEDQERRRIALIGRRVVEVRAVGHVEDVDVDHD